MLRAVLIICIILAAVIFLISGPASPITGFFWGLAIAAIEAAGFSFFFDRMSHGSLADLFRRYSMGAFIRIPILLAIFFCAAKFVLQGDARIGIIVGIGIGMAAFAVLSFKKLGTLAQKLQQARD